MSISITDTFQEGRVKLVTNQQIESIQGRLIWNLQAARSTINIALLNNQSN